MHHIPQDSWARLTVRLVSPVFSSKRRARLVSGKWGLACAAGPACQCLTLLLYYIYRECQGESLIFFQNPLL